MVASVAAAHADDGHRMVVDRKSRFVDIFESAYLTNAVVNGFSLLENCLRAIETYLHVAEWNRTLLIPFFDNEGGGSYD